jgi:hypothetical protein
MGMTLEEMEVHWAKRIHEEFDISYHKLMNTSALGTPYSTFMARLRSTEKMEAIV